MMYMDSDFLSIGKFEEQSSVELIAILVKVGSDILAEDSDAKDWGNRIL